MQPRRKPSKGVGLSLLVLLLIPAWVGTAKAQLSDWPNWRGPLHNGTSPDANPPIHWSETNNVRFKVPIPGESLASPIVHGDRVYVVTAVALDEAVYATNKDAAQAVVDRGEWPPKVAAVGHQFRVYAFDRDNGDLVWERLASERVPHESHYLDSSYACASPLTDGERLYVHFGSNGTYVYTLDGDLLWETDLGDMTARRGFGEASSPALSGDLLVVNWDHEGDSFIVALDKKTGREVWRTERPGEVTSWSTPLIVQHQGRNQVVVSATGRSRGYDLLTGKELWSLGGMTVNQIPTPIHNQGVVYLASGYRGNMLQAVDLATAKGELEGTEAVLWNYERDTPYVATPLLYGHNLYFIKHFRNILTVLDASTGEVRYNEVRLPDLRQIYSSPVGAAGRVYIFGRDGNALVLEDGPSFKILAHNVLDDDVDATPALVGDRMYVRGRHSLYCLEADVQPSADG